MAAPSYGYVSLTPPSSPESLAKAYSYITMEEPPHPINEGLAALFLAVDIVDKENRRPDAGVARIEHAKPEVVHPKRGINYRAVSTSRTSTVHY